MPHANLPFRPRARKPDLTVGQILAWGDAFRQVHGRWPTIIDGGVDGTADQTWAAADQSLRAGHRGLPGVTTLAKLLLKCRGRRHRHLPPDLTIPQMVVVRKSGYRYSPAMPSSPTASPVIPPCPRCGSAHVVRNGRTHSGTPGYRCRGCDRRFVADPARGPAPDATRDLIRRLLAERLSLRAIARVAGVSRSWLRTFVNGLLRDDTPYHPGPLKESPAGW